MAPSNISVSPAICRICRSGEQSIAYDKSSGGESLISPCLCRGTIGLYHRSCLERWLASANRSTCEICDFTYQIARRYRTFCEFIGSRDSYLERRNLITDLICFVFFTPIVIGCVTLCLSTASQKRLWNDVASFQTTSLWILSILLSIVYSVWLIIITMFHTKTYLNWRIRNEEILVIDLESINDSLGAIDGVERQRSERLLTYAMHLCFDLRSFLHDLCRKNLNASSTSNANSDKSDSRERERRTSVLSSITLSMNYNDFVIHLQPEEGAIPVTDLYQHMLASTPVPKQEAIVPLQIFEYPPVDSHLARSNVAA